MASLIDENAERQQWNSRKTNWQSIYQWDRSSGVKYTEQIAQWIVESFTEIELVTKDLRQTKPFKRDHRGQAKLQPSDGQPMKLTEKRYIRALFNLQRIPLLGEAIDYEVPLQETLDAKHGDVDLLCYSSRAIFCVEAKRPGSSESILKGILQAFVYTSLIAIRREVFLAEYGFPNTTLLVPAVLTFRSASSGRQLRRLNEYRHLTELIGKLNSKLEKSGAGRIRFFIINDDQSEMARLTTEAQPKGDPKVIFANGFTPDVEEVVVT